MLTDEQSAVVRSEAPRLVVTAAAGAGKTRVLVERYLRHVIDDGIRPDAILTITFTKKAAAEMKGRIVAALRARDRYDDAQSAETGPIQTIHSFCERLLRENALAAGLDPAFEVLDDGASNRLMAECIREALASDLEDEPFAERLVSHLAGRSQVGANRARSPYARLEDEVARVLDALRSAGEDPQITRARHATPDTLNTFWEATILSAIPKEAALAFSKVNAPSFQERIAAAYKAAGLRAGWYNGKPDLKAEAESLEQTCGLVQLACAAWWRLEREMNRRQALDFTELEARAVRLLTRNDTVRQNLADRFAVAMVDEAQDVNPQQNRLLEALGIGQTMLVGDAQQSIYAFRLADVELFRSRTADGALRLSRNWRSRAGILRFVDDLFRPLWAGYEPMAPQEAPFRLDESSPSPDFEGVEVWRHPQVDPTLTAEYVRQLSDGGVRFGDIAILVRSAHAAQRYKQSLDGEGIPSRIAGGAERFYTRLEVRDLANTLRACADPYDDYALLAALRSPMANLSLDAVVTLAADGPGVIERLEPENLLAEADQTALTEFLTWYRPLAKIADRLTAGEALAEILARSPFLPRMARREDGLQAIANARKLLSLALREPELGPREYAERIWETQEVRHKEGDAPADAADDVVTIMTIHKSKGLEFPVVILPETMASFRPSPKEVAIDARLGMLAVKPGKTPSLAHRFLEDVVAKRESEEGLRLLYVALTRAKSRLCLCVYPPNGRPSMNAVLHHHFKSGVGPGIVVRDALAEPE